MRIVYQECADAKSPVDPQPENDDDLMALQPDGTWKRGGDGRSKLVKRKDLPKGAVLTRENDNDVEMEMSRLRLTISPPATKKRFP